MYKLDERERMVIGALLMTAHARQEMLESLVRTDTTTLTIPEFEADLATLRTPITSKQFKSEFLDNILKERLDTFNPVRYLDKYKKDIQVDKYLFMLKINIRVLEDLDLRALKGEEVS